MFINSHLNINYLNYYIANIILFCIFAMYK
nr:MAG TPA: hypothetical protein [Caudoviricetes sp.]